MNVQDGQIPAYLVAQPGPVVVALCTVCGLWTVKPHRAMVDRHGSVITDGCGDCPSVSASQPARIDDDGLGPVFIVHGNGTVIRGWGDLTPQEASPGIPPTLPPQEATPAIPPQEATPAIPPASPHSPGYPG